jgi:hypothetical protein
MPAPLAAQEIAHSFGFESVRRCGILPSVTFNLPLKYMSLQKKLSAMESLWEDRTRTPEAIESPAWHKDILDERRQHVAEGSSRFVEWETAKADIRNKPS